MHSGLPNVNADAAGRAMQGILSGVGFIVPVRCCGSARVGSAWLATAACTSG